MCLGWQYVSNVYVDSAAAQWSTGKADCFVAFNNSLYLIAVNNENSFGAISQDGIHWSTLALPHWGTITAASCTVFQNHLVM